MLRSDGSALFGLVWVAFCILVAIALTLIARPRFLLTAPLALSFVTFRLGGGVISIADVGLLLGVAAAICLVRQVDIARDLAVMWPPAIYAGLLLLPVVANPTGAAVFEWVRRGYLMVGGLLVGVVLVRTGALRRATRVFICISLVMAIVAIAHFVTVGGPFYPLGLSKNHVGRVLALALVLALVRARSAAIALAPCAVLLFGIVGVGSRGALVGAAAGAIVGTLLRPNVRVAAKLAVVAGASLLSIAAYSSTIEERGVAAEDTAAGSRAEFRKHATDDWADSPLLGKGLRYYEDPTFGFPVAPVDDEGVVPVRHPHSVLFESLAESGAVGFGALGILLAGSVVIGVRARSDLGRAGVAAVVVVLMHGAVDIYWLAGSTPIPWIILGAAHSDRRTRAEAKPRVDVTQESPTCALQ